MTEHNLGITDVEDKQMAALSAGASPELVASASNRPIDTIPTMYKSQGYSDVRPETLYPEEQEARSKYEVADRAMYAALSTDEDSVEATFTVVKQELEAGDMSVSEDQLQQQAATAETGAVHAAIGDIAATGNIQATESAIAASDEVVEARSSLRIQGLERASEAYMGREETERSVRYRADYTTHLSDEARFVKKLDRMIDHHVADTAGDIGSFGLDILDAAVIPEQIIGLSKVTEEILGETSRFTGGTAVMLLAQKLKSTPIEGGEREELAFRIIESYARNAGTFTDNDVSKVFALELFRDFYNAPGQDIPLDRWLGDIFGTIDLASFLPAGAAVKLASRSIKGAMSATKTAKMRRMHRDLQQADPDLDAKITAAAIKSERAADEVGTTQADELARVHPSVLDDSSGALMEGAPASVREAFLGTKTRSESIRDYVTNTYMYTDADYAAKQIRISTVAQSAGTLGKAKVSSSVIKRNENKNAIDVDLVYGDETDLPLTLENARALSTKLQEAFLANGIKGEKPRIRVRNTMDSTLELADDANIKPDSGYFVSVQTQIPLVEGDIVGDVIGAADSTKPAGWIARYFFKDPNTWAARSMLGAARIASDAKFFQSHELTQLAKPFFKLNRKSKNLVASILQEGEEAETVYSYANLQKKLSDKEINAYYSSRFLNDTAYRIKNADARAKMEAEGWKSFNVSRAESDPYRNAIKPATKQQVADSTTVIFDPYNNTKIILNPGELDRLEHAGFTFGKLKHSADIGTENFTYSLVKKQDIGELPDNIIQYHAGYNFRINKDPYFIEEATQKLVDGKMSDSRRTVRVARSSNEAEKTVKELNDQPGKAVYTSKIDRRINSSETILKLENDLLDGSGNGLWFSKRGDKMHRMDGSDAAVENPEVAMRSLISATSNKQTHSELVDTMVTRHRKTYGSVEIEGKKLWEYDVQSGKYHFNKGLAKETSDRPDIVAAGAEYGYIENLKYSPSAVDKQWKNWMQSLDYIIGQNLGETASKISKTVLLDVLAKNTPGTFTRGLTFNLTIALNPLRHIFLQSLSAIHLGAISPLDMIKSYKDMGPMMLAMKFSNNPTAVKSIAVKFARASGMKEKEFLEHMEAFRKSGKAYAIDSDVMVGESNLSWSSGMADSLAGHVAQKIGKIARAPTSIGKAVGFEMGEMANQMAAWNFAVRQWKKQNPGRTPYNSQRAMDTVNNSARNFSVDMTNTSALGYQRGALASMTQFMAIQTKMATKLLGMDKAITPTKAAHARFVAGMAVLYGSAGAGMQSMYEGWRQETGVDIDPTLDSFLYGGLMQAMFDTATDVAMGLERGTTKGDEVSSFSPSSGIVEAPVEFVKNLFDGSLAEALSGPSGSVLPKMADAARYVGDLWYLRDTMDTPELVLKGFQRTFEQFGVFSSYYKMNAAMAYKEKFDKMFIVGKDGKPTVEANSMADIWKKGLLGVGIRSERELYDKWLSDYRDVNSSGKKHEAQIDTDADAGWADQRAFRIACTCSACSRSWFVPFSSTLRMLYSSWPTARSR